VIQRNHQLSLEYDQQAKRGTTPLSADGQRRIQMAQRIRDHVLAQEKQQKDGEAQRLRVEEEIKKLNSVVNPKTIALTTVVVSPPS
jgi:hypothetical protein